ncbi:MAG: cbb3-type cytochrome oxidase assembly protein CcoS [Thiofilum sp.]|uniref:cbb3-type cytochrome oxidase assembly protein CcoS n=1 Tax=Thiofilum sp. TaxID=2212733 RepID=UPI0025F62872|nr:cbb3-type cytochrome oxidase assembly protein CcoS [Thiofilum sp.]MBK8453465.1 cbb3-type cytochrome oxidase assembly protein CcoS [Thiofilum sp.]
MDALYMLIPIAIGVMFVIVIAFIYTVKSGQYDDLEGPAHRILMDDDDPRIPHQSTEPQPTSPSDKLKE